MIGSRLRRRLPLLALAVVALAGALAVLLPSAVDAQTSLGNTRPFIRPGTETGDLLANVRYWKLDGSKHTTTMGDYLSGSDIRVWSQIDPLGSWNSTYQEWRITVQSEPGANGARIEGAVLTSPTTGWSNRLAVQYPNTCGTARWSSWSNDLRDDYSYRQGSTSAGCDSRPNSTTDDGFWPSLANLNVRATIEFTVPSSHIGPVYLHFHIHYNISRRVEVKYLDPRASGPSVSTLSEGGGGLEACADGAEVHAGAATTASNLLPTRDGAANVQRWEGTTRTWSSYAEDAQGTATAGSTNFAVSSGDLLYVGSADAPTPACADVNQGAPRGVTASARWATGRSEEGEATGYGRLKYREIDDDAAALILIATNGAIVHEELCPHLDDGRRHPLDTTPMATSERCEISRTALMQAQGTTDLDDEVAAFDFVYVPEIGSAATGSVGAAFKTIYSAESQTLTLAHGDEVSTDGAGAAVFLDWADAGREYATATPAALFAVGRTGQALPMRAIPSGLSWFKFEDLAEAKAVELSIDHGTIAYGDEECAADEEAGTCTLALSRTQLLAGTQAPNNDDLTGNLRVEYALPLPITGAATLSIKAWQDGEDDPVTASLELADLGVAAAEAASTWLPTDADDTLAPGQTVPIAAGFTVAIDAEGDGWGCAGLGPSFLELTGQQELHHGCLLARSAADPAGAPAPASRWLSDDAYLVISGPATFAANGGKRLSLDGDWSHLRCGPARAAQVSGAGERDIACWVVDADGERPQIVLADDADEDLTLTASIEAAEGRTLRLFTGSGRETPLDRYAEASVFELPRERFGATTLKVGAVRELGGIALSRLPAAGSLEVPTGPIRVSSRGAMLRLAITNENGQAARLASLSSITLTLDGGGRLTGWGCSGSSCSIRTSRGALFEAVQTDPNQTAQIDLTYEAPDKPGEAAIRATVIGRDGSRFTDNLALVISGTASALSGGDATPRVHSSATEDDDRDKILIPITARDAGGNAARMPLDATATVRGPDGEGLPDGSHSATVKCEGVADEPRLRCNVEVIITADPSSPLKSGAYIATVRGGGIGSSEVSFAVGGPADKVGISIPAMLPGLGRTFTATASVADKSGVPVADGTWVEFRTTGTGAGAKTAVLASPPEADVEVGGRTVRQRRAQTKDGTAIANVIVVGEGVAIISATAGGKSANEPLDTRAAAAAAAETGPSLRFGTADGAAALGLPATWTSAQSDARAALAAVPDASVAWLWNGRRWIRWGLTADGAPLPGSASTPFPILPGDLLWFAS